MDADDRTLRLASSTTPSSMNTTTNVDSNESESSATTIRTADVLKKPPFKRANSNNDRSEQQNSSGSEKKAPPGKQLNFGMETILRLSTDLKSALDPSLMSAFEIVQRPMQQSTGGGGSGTTKHANKRTTSSSSSSSSSSSALDPPGANLSHLTNLSPYEIYAATKAYSDNLYNNGGGNGSGSTSELSNFGHHQQQQQHELPPTVRSTTAATTASTVAVNQQLQQQQPSLSSLYQYYASLGGSTGGGGNLTSATTANSAGQSQQLQPGQQLPNLAGTWPPTPTGYDALGAATAAASRTHVGSLSKNPLFETVFIPYDQDKANSSSSTLMAPTIESCLSSAYHQLGQQYGGVPYSHGSSGGFYPNYSTLMSMTGQGQSAIGAGAGHSLAMAQQQMLLANNRKALMPHGEHLIALREQHINPAIHKALQPQISSTSLASVHHPHPHHPQQQQQSQSGNSHNSQNRSSSSNGHHQPSEKKGKRSWSRAVFSNSQRRGLEKRFLLQKYITKPDRRNLAESLGLTDAQVKVWFQNRRMKWRHSNFYQEELRASLRRQELSSLMAKAAGMQGKGGAVGDSSTSSFSSGQPVPSTMGVTAVPAALSRAVPEMFHTSIVGPNLLTSKGAIDNSSSVCSSPPSSPRSSLSSCHGVVMSVSVLNNSSSSSKSSPPVVLHEPTMPKPQYSAIKPLLLHAGSAADLLSVK